MLLKLSERNNSIFQMKEYKLSRREIIFKTSVIIYKITKEFMEKVIDKNEGKTIHEVQVVKQSSLLFN